MTTLQPILRGLATLAVLAAPAFAHHIFYEEFDRNKPLALTGRIESVKWSDPHTTFTLIVASGTSKGEWTLEAASPDTLKKQDFPTTKLKAGDTVTVHAYRAADGSMTASARSIRVQGGQMYSLCNPQEDGGPKAPGVPQFPGLADQKNTIQAKR